jgi:hypothetical protein
VKCSPRQQRGNGEGRKKKEGREEEEGASADAGRLRAGLLASKKGL